MAFEPFAIFFRSIFSGIVIILALAVVGYKLVQRFGNAQEKKWREWATQIGMNYVPRERKGIFARMKEYKIDLKNPRIRRRKEKILTGSARGAEITGYFVHEMHQVGTKQRYKPTKFELEFVDKHKGFPETIITKKRWLGNIFIKTPENMKVTIPPQLGELFQVTSAWPEKAEKIVKEISSLLTKDMKDLKITLSNHTISLTIKRIKITPEKLFTIKKIGRKILEAGEHFDQP